MSAPNVVRCITYLAPSIPRSFYAYVVGRIGLRLGVPTSLELDVRRSAPCAARNPFSTGEVELGFMCAPGYVNLSQLDPSPIELLPVAPVYDDPRAGGRPVYFSDLIVNRRSHLRSLDDMNGCTFAINDRSSLSGYYNLLRQLHDRSPVARPRFALRDSGSHLRSIELVARGGAHAAAIDSNALRLATGRCPELREEIRVIDTWGPFAIQPIVVRSDMDSRLKEDIASVLLELANDPAARRTLARYQVQGFAPIGPEAYEGERRLLREVA